jgi:PAS domain-containing protein
MMEQSLLNLGFRPLLEAALDASVVVDSLGRVVALNREGERLLGWSEPELLGQPMNRLVPPRFHRILDTLPAFNQQPQENQVDSEPILNRLRNLGIGYAQGHALAVPQPLADSEGEVALPCFQQVM